MGKAYDLHLDQVKDLPSLWLLWKRIPRSTAHTASLITRKLSLGNSKELIQRTYFDLIQIVMLILNALTHYNMVLVSQKYKIIILKNSRFEKLVRFLINFTFSRVTLVYHCKRGLTN